MTYEWFQSVLTSNLAWAAGLAGAMLGLTALAGKLLHPDRKDEIALWLIGAAEDTWHRTFCALFDAVFGERHLSWRCIWRSAAASILAVALIWLFMGNLGLIGHRVEAGLSLGTVLLLALGVNLVADYLSLLETRWLLGQMHRFRAAWQQALVLLVDLLISAAIIWMAIWLIGPVLHAGEKPDLAMTLGAFSVFSILFYSTFLTSVWTWGYILSSWIVRLFRGLRLSYWLNVEGKPVAVLGHVLGVLTFIGSLGIGAAFKPDAAGLTAADRFICDTFPGKVCMRMTALTSSSKEKTALVIRACEGEITEFCRRIWRSILMEEPQEAVRLIKAVCTGGDFGACVALGVHHEEGIYEDVDLATSAYLYDLSCRNGYPAGCTNLGIIFAKGIGIAPDQPEAERLFIQACYQGDVRGCIYQHVLMRRQTDWIKTARNNAIPCVEGYFSNCARPHIEQELSILLQVKAASNYFRRSCGDGETTECISLGYLHEKGIGMHPDPVEAARLYVQGCEGGNSLGCSYSGDMYERGLGVDKDLNQAEAFYIQGCDGGDDWGCKALNRLKAAQ